MKIDDKAFIKPTKKLELFGDDNVFCQHNKSLIIYFHSPSLHIPCDYHFAYYCDNHFKSNNMLGSVYCFIVTFQSSPQIWRHLHQSLQSSLACLPQSKLEGVSGVLEGGRQRKSSLLPQGGGSTQKI